ncbi:hypothetical protein A2U01_0113169, partial [Trifolium medium]|nr:hypothetical protein [Trifolium medium]
MTTHKRKPTPKAIEKSSAEATNNWIANPEKEGTKRRPQTAATIAEESGVA